MLLVVFQNSTLYTGQKTAQTKNLRIVQLYKEKDIMKESIQMTDGKDMQDSILTN